jgi:hypothetical protein
VCHDVGVCHAPRFRDAQQTIFVVHQGPLVHGKHSLSCARGTQRTTKSFSIYIYFNLVIKVNVLKLSNGSEKLPYIRIRQYKLYIAYIKNFICKFKFELHYGYKPNQVALNTLNLYYGWFLKTIHDDLLKTLYMIFHKLNIGYRELMIFKLCMHFIQLKILQTACGFS